MSEHRMLVGADIELLGVPEYSCVGDWENWHRLLSTLPDKGEKLDLGDGYWTHRDGLTAEFGFDPCTTKDQFMRRLTHGKQATQENLGVHLSTVDAFSCAIPMELPDMKAFLEMGCAPDQVINRDGSVHTRRVPPHVAALPIRECSGHIHISLPQPYLDSPELAAQFVVELDSVVYPLARGIEPVAQATWYRKPRVFRYTPYGIEYRSLGAGSLYGPQADMIMDFVFNIVNNVWGVTS